MKHIQQTIVILALYLTALAVNAEEIPSEILTLQSRRKVQTEKIDRIYIKELEKLKVKYTKRGDLTNANLVVDLISKAEATNVNVLNGTWQTSFIGHDDKFLRVFKNGIMIDNLGAKHKVVLKDGVVTIEWGKSRNDVLKFSPKRPNVMEGNVVQRGGLRKVIYIRVK